MQLIADLFYWIFKELQFHFYYKPIFHKALDSHYPFYSKLNERQKKRFLRLVRDQYEYFQFVPRDDLRLTAEKKAIISAGAAHVVYNLPEHALGYYTHILVYSGDYHSRITGKMHRGEVNPGMKIIVFSWKGVEEGLRRDEGVNLLLHEFAHALWLEHKLRSGEPVFNPYHVERFEELAQAEMARLAADEDHFFRKYAFENMHEFFAVAVENFFERPRQFKQAMPHFYDVCKELFKQDPAAYA